MVYHEIGFMIGIIGLWWFYDGFLKNYSVSPFLNGLMEGSVLHRFRFLLS